MARLYVLWAYTFRILDCARARIACGYTRIRGNWIYPCIPRERSRYCHSNTTLWLYLILRPKCSAWCFWKGVCSPDHCTQPREISSQHLAHSSESESPSRRLGDTRCFPQQFPHQVRSTSCTQDGGDDHINALFCVVFLSWAKASVSFPNLWQGIIAGGMSGEPYLLQHPLSQML